MGKSRGNYIGLDEPPREMYGKTMSIPDSLILRYGQLCTASQQAVQAISGHLDADEPREAKMRLAREIVTLYHGPEAARAAEDEFVRVFSRGELPEEMPEVVLAPDALRGMAGPVRLSRLIVAAGLAPSNSEARRLIAQGGVRYDGARLDDPECTVTPRDGVVVQVGRRRVARLRIAKEPGGVH
jgi:tyrosyl-tRNA synthetase